MASADSLTDRLLVRWALPSWPGERAVCARSPLRLGPAEANALVALATRLDRLLRRLSGDLLRPAAPFKEFRPEFPLAKEFFAAGPLTHPLFWGRFDVFERAAGGLAVLEYNCDKPAGQREVWAGAALESGRSNPNHGARSAFRRALVEAWRVHSERWTRAERPRVAILADPSHGEEFRLAYIYGREIARLGWQWTVVGPDNIGAESERAVAYGETVDIVLRQYPAEFLHELPAIADLWRLASAGSLLFLNDPRAVATQAKSLFALAWKLASEGRLPRADVRLVLERVPPTGLAAEHPWLAHAEARPEDWVIKPVLGRYSQGVALGVACSPEDWKRALEAAAARPHDYIIQAYVPPRWRWLPAPGGARGGYVNWGVALAGGRFAGLCPRFQATALTEEARTWWTPLRVGRVPTRAPRLLWPRGRFAAEMRRHRARPDGRWRGPGRTALAVADRCAMAGYTNVWTDGMLNFSLGAIALSRADWEELSLATKLVKCVAARVHAYLDDPAVVELLGIPPAVARLAVSASARGRPDFLARLDWARTMSGRWQLLEINSETPAGLWEAQLAARRIARLHRGITLPPVDLGSGLVAAWRASVGDALGAAALEAALVVGLVGVIAAQEDRDQLRAHALAARTALPRARLVLGDISELRADGAGASLRSNRLDVLFRYYPLDWCAGPQFAPLLELVAAGRLTMIPGASALVPQSKAFLALLHQLERHGFFQPDEAAAVRHYVPPTFLDPGPLRRSGWVAKPFLEREGLGVRFSHELRPTERRQLRYADRVFQQRLELASAQVPIATARGWRTEQRFLVFGVFLAAGEVAGIYTRAGAVVTGREAVFVPVVLERHDH